MAITDPREGEREADKKIITRKFNYTMNQLFLDNVCTHFKLRENKISDFFCLVPLS
jgi:hypothetical protein